MHLILDPNEFENGKNKELRFSRNFLNKSAVADSNINNAT